MKRLTLLAAIMAVLLTGSTALAGWVHVAPVPVVVHSFYPVGPVYAYPAPAVVPAPAPIPPAAVYTFPSRFRATTWVGPWGHHAVTWVRTWP